MKYIFKEYTDSYREYKYPFTVYGKKDDGDNVDDIFNSGFLPSRIEKDLFFLSRNLRINLANFELTSENRRILKKNENLEIQNSALENYNYEIAKLATDYFKEKFGKKIISTQKLKQIFEEKFFTNLLTYSQEKKDIGYCITMETENLIHYAYPFYDKNLINTNTGMGMMLKAIIYAKENKKKYIYLGTIYTPNALYKLQFNGLEWFNGDCWCNDINILKEKIHGGK